MKIKEQDSNDRVFKKIKQDKIRQSRNTNNTTNNKNKDMNYDDVLEKLEAISIKLETYNDYPESASNNACKVLRWIDEHGRDEVKGMTRTGLARANQLCKKSNISRDTIARMASFKRHEKNAEINPEFESTPWKDKGYVAWLGWGGTSGINWAINKLKQIDNK